MSAFDRVREGLKWTCNPDSTATTDAIAALAEIERERAFQAENLQHISKVNAELRAELSANNECLAMVGADCTKAERERDELRRTLSEAQAQRDQFLADAAFAEKECDELRAKLTVIEQHHQFTPADNYPALLRQFQAMHNVLRARELAASEANRRCHEMAGAVASLESERAANAALTAEVESLRAKLAECERQVPVAWAWNDALGCMHAHCGSRRPVWVDGECSDAKRAETSLRPLYAAPPIPRVEQEPVAWVLFDDIFIAPKDMQDDPPNLECMKPLYAHPLALREPTEDECRRIANEFLILGGPEELAGRVMFNAVREVMTK